MIRLRFGSAGPTLTHRRFTMSTAANGVSLLGLQEQMNAQNANMAAIMGAVQAISTTVAGLGGGQQPAVVEAPVVARAPKAKGRKVATAVAQVEQARGVRATGRTSPSDYARWDAYQDGRLAQGRFRVSDWRGACQVCHGGEVASNQPVRAADCGVRQRSDDRIEVRLASDAVFLGQGSFGPCPFFVCSTSAMEGQ